MGGRFGGCRPRRETHLRHRGPGRLEDQSQGRYGRSQAGPYAGPSKRRDDVLQGEDSGTPRLGGDAVPSLRPRPVGEDVIRVAHLSTVDITLRFLVVAQLLKLRDEGYDVTAISAPGPFTSDLESLGIRHVPWTHATRA